MMARKGLHVVTVALSLRPLNRVAFEPTILTGIALDSVQLLDVDEPSGERPARFDDRSSVEPLGKAGCGRNTAKGGGLRVVR